MIGFKRAIKFRFLRMLRGNVDGSYDTEINMIMAYMYFERKGCVQQNLYSKCSSI